MKPQKYIATIEADALQFTSASAVSIVEWLGLPERCCFLHGVDPETGSDVEGFLVIPTPIGDVRAVLGDFIVRLPGGAAWPCKPDVFALAYRPAS
ncbi:hypothetical protein C0J29_32150 (plasmid) [Mycobacterium paragordonae]|uniref:Uncharacterized protein n=1 Tax=Mycobacterium paragordonae TaxID=1389713 RepID=A0ABQ1CFD8_9MYCO|nr:MULTISPECIES: hypothetical protein [Mycobacterium]AYE99611.1 hypothetical protein C0J29_32150 [Mycobacterium paragordonae]QNI09726.1 hypothetical protein GAN17_25340 [Mycobacterium kubicae]QNI15263.1 hypothetical protein GAN18_29220 [Mycobacterium kubicae]GFG83160.1 hypothetical protein MPRG_64360 [Mycobacterium paragordonae]